MNTSTENFAESADAADKQARGLRNPLGPEDAHPRVPKDDPRNPFGRAIEQMKWDLDHCIFVVFRPWESCALCRGRHKAGTLVLPDEGDHTCPHTQIKDYRKLLQDRADGVCRFYETETTTLKNGTIIKSVGVARPKTKEDLEASSRRAMGETRAPKL